MYRTTLKKSKYCARHSTHTWEPWKSSKIHVTQYRARHRGGVNIKAPKTVKLPHKRNESLRYSTTLKNSKNQTFSKVSYTEGGIPQLCHTQEICVKNQHLAVDVWESQKVFSWKAISPVLMLLVAPSKSVPYVIFRNLFITCGSFLAKRLLINVQKGFTQN